MTRGLLSFLSNNVIALVALFVALGGSAYAATALPAGSVGTKQLKNAAVTSSKIKASAVSSVTIADNSITGADVLESSLGQVPSASNADSVGGISSADLLQGGGSILHARLTEPLNSGNATVLSVPGFGTIEASTGFGGIPNYRLFWRNGLSGTNVDVWFTIGATTTYVNLAPGGGSYIAPVDTATDGIYTLRVSYGSHAATVITSAHADATGGVFSSQAIAQ
jgi:hypothetical protein